MHFKSKNTMIEAVCAIRVLQKSIKTTGSWKLMTGSGKEATTYCFYDEYQLKNNGKLVYKYIMLNEEV